MNRVHSRSFSHDVRQENSEIKNEQATSGAPKERNSSLAKSLQQTKLPVIKIKKVMKKIGAIEKSNGNFIPSDQDRLAFRKSKWKQLKDQYITKGNYKQPFDYELDEIVLDCWQYGENFGRKTIWRKYKQQFDELTFDTLRVVHKKKM